MLVCRVFVVFFFQAEDGIRDLVRSRGLGDVYKRQLSFRPADGFPLRPKTRYALVVTRDVRGLDGKILRLSLIHI